jgi:hypothetical protein
MIFSQDVRILAERLFKSLRRLIAGMEVEEPFKGFS